MWAVVGLGNPGRQYSGTRHNVGVTLVQGIAKAWKVKLRKKIFFSKAAEAERNKAKVLLAIPLTYMNKSGQAVKKILEGRRIKLENLIVVYDDLDIPLGEIKVKKRGGPGNHKGMISIVQEIASEEFPRIRIGIGPLSAGENAVHYVLSRFDRRETPLLKESLKKAQEAVELVLAGETEKAMNIYNQRGKTLSNSP